jgi:3-phenylpropionate/trans-cinnamate dioxygenase ferredoxin subunit
MAREKQHRNIGRSKDFPVGEMKLVELGGREIGVIRLHGGELRAVMNRCPHKGAPICRGIVGGVWDSTGPGELTLDNSRDVLVCPWHGFEFDLKTGREVCWKRPASLRMYPIEDADGEVVVSI